MAQLRYRLVRVRAGSVVKWTWVTTEQLETVKHRKFTGKIDQTHSKHWQITDTTSLEIDSWLLPYVIESSGEGISSTDVENA